MSKLLIIGNQNPEIGKEYYYSLSIMGFGSMPNNIFNPHPEIAKWEIHVLENGKWRKTKGNSKQGDTAPYTFNQSSLTRKGIKICVTKGDDTGEIIIKPKRARQPKINKIELLDVNGNKVTKPLSYSDTLSVKAYCTDMEGETVQFTLWEDDAKGEGHNKINLVNKINAFPVPGTVRKGVAKAKFNMATYTMASFIANMQVAKGDKNEGKTHEYYATAEYFGKLEASNNVNLQNPSHPNPAPTSGNKSGATKPPAKQQPNQRPVPPPPAPKKDTYKTPITPKAKTKSPDPQGKIISVEFVDMVGKPYKKMKFGTHVKAKIVSKNMTGKTVRLKIWEDDISNVLLFEKDYILGGNETFITLFLTAQMRKDGDDWKEGNEQEYFLEIEYAGQSIDSEVINVNDSAPKIKVAEPAVSMTGVGKTPAQKQNETCACQQYDLVWGGHPNVSCAFRKKVVEISKRQNFDPNHLMAVMKVESAGTFSPSKIELVIVGYRKNGKPIREYRPLSKTEILKKDENFSGAVGLIQFTPVAIKELNSEYGYSLTKRKLALMTQLDQLDYVEKYIKYWKKANSINTKLTLADLYLVVFAPGKMNGSDDNTTLYAKDTDYYNANDSVDTDGKNGITKKEIAARAYSSFAEGLANKEKEFECGGAKEEEATGKSTDSKWHDPIDYSQRTYYNSSGVHKEQNGAFGPVRTKIVKGKAVPKNHQGLDLFADINTPCKACLDGIIVSYMNEGAAGYGNVLVLEVTGEDLRKAKKDYKLEFSLEKESGSGFDVNAEKFYLRYAHLKSAVKTEGKVKAGETICYSGDTGNAKGVPNPHLHFEVAMKKSGNGSGLANRYNPAFFVNLKPINKVLQDEVKKKRS